VNFPSAWRYNQQRSVEEGRKLLGGNHAMKSVKPSVDILEGLSTGVSMGISAPHLIHKLLSESRHSPSFMLGGLGLRKVAVTNFCAPRPSMPYKLSMSLKLSVPLRLAALEPPSKPYANRIVQSFFCAAL
jgi:hypothetical protein